MADGEIIDLFAGPGGWSEGLRMLGLSDLGIEWDDAACATREAAGHRTLQADVSELDPADFAPCWGLIASPPCQDFSVAGLRRGITGEKGKHVLEVPRWVNAIRPTWVACEQVPPVIDIWKLFSRWFEEWGYSTWVGILNAADYGVPQTRERAFLLAHLDAAVQPPEPTHAKGGAAEGMFTPARLPWVTMAEALGWSEGLVVNTRGERTTPGGNEFPAGPSWTLTEKARSWLLHTNRGQDEDGNRQTVSAGAGRSALTVKAGGQWEWTFHRPATAVCGDPRIFEPKYRTGTERAGDNAIKVIVAEALTLQGFRPDYPVQGTKTKQFEQVGNAVCPPVAARIIAALTGRTIVQEEAA